MEGTADNLHLLARQDIPNDDIAIITCEILSWMTGDVRSFDLPPLSSLSPSGLRATAFTPETW